MTQPRQTNKTHNQDYPETKYVKPKKRHDTAKEQSRTTEQSREEDNNRTKQRREENRRDETRRDVK